MENFEKGERVKLNEEGKKIFSRTSEPYTAVITGLPRDENKGHVYITLDGRDWKTVCSKDFLELIPDETEHPN